MNGAGLGAGAGCCALAAPANSAADAASATSAIRFMLVLPDFSTVRDRRFPIGETARPLRGGAPEYATFRGTGECAPLGKRMDCRIPPKGFCGLNWSLLSHLRQQARHPS